MTAVLATAFVVLAIVLAALAVRQGSAESVDTSLQRVAPVDPLGQAAGAAPAAVPAPVSSAPAAPADPLSGSTKK